jgi:tetrahydromethanopterin S-methyltransferase subunit B
METAKILQELQPIQERMSKAETFAKSLKITNTEEMQSATDALGQIMKVAKVVTEKKETMTKPLNLALKNLRAFFSPIEKQCDAAISIIKEKMTDYQIAEEKEAAKQAAKIEKKVEAGKMSLDKAAEKIEAATPQKTVEAKSGSIQFRTIREVVIEDEKKIPRLFLIPNMVLIRKEALAGIEIPGIKVIEKKVVAGTTN